MLNTTHNQTRTANLPQELEDFSWKYNHVQPINCDTSPEDLAKKSYALSQFIEQGAVIANQLTFIHIKIMLGFEHAVIKFECTQCDEGQPVIMYTGLYPSRPEYCPYFAYNCSNETDLSWIKNKSYQLALEKHNSFNYSSSTTISFPITADTASHLLTHIDEAKNDHLPQYSYNKISYNCIDFAQDIYKEAGYEGHYMDILYEDKTMHQHIMADQDLRSWVGGLEFLIYYLEG